MRQKVFISLMLAFILALTFGIMTGCGNEEITTPAYTSVSGTVSLYKSGTTSASISGVTVVITDSDGNVLSKGNDYLIETGQKGVFTISNILTGTYTITFSLSGYISYSSEVTLTDNNDSISATLYYTTMEMSPADKDSGKHDFSYTSAADSYVKITGDAESLNAMTIKSYDDVSTTFTAKASQSNDSDKKQGIFYLFEDGSYIAVAVDGTNYKFETVDGLWNIGTLVGDTSFGATLTSAQQTAFNSDSGLDITVVRKGTKIYGVIDEEIIWKMTVSSIEGKTCQAGIFAYSPKTSEFHYSVSEDLTTVEYVAQSFNVSAYNAGVTGSISAEDLVLTISSSTATLTEGIDYKLVSNGNGFFTVKNIKEGTYTVSITANGYTTYSESLEFVEDSTNIDVTIKYLTMEMSPKNYDSSVHDFSNSSDGYVTLTANKTLNAMSVDSYNDVSISFTIKESQSRHSDHIQGIFYLFEDGSYFAVQYHGSNYHLQMNDGLWNLGSTYIGTAWYGAEISQEYRDAFASDEGLTITILRCGTSIYGMVGNDILWRKDIASIADKTCQVGIFAFDGVAGGYHFNISEDTSIINASITMPESTDNGSITASKTTGIKVYDDITLTVSPDTNYIVKSLTVNGVDVTESIVNETYTFSAALANTVAVEFEEYIEVSQIINIDFYNAGNTTEASEGVTLTISQDGEALTAGTDYTISQDGGVYTITHIGKGVYTVSASSDGYLTYSDTVTFAGDETELDITLFYLTMTMSPTNYDSGVHDFSYSSDGIVTLTAAKTLNAMTIDSYTDASITFTVKSSQSTHTNKVQGIFLLFSDDSYIAVQLNATNSQFAIMSGLWSTGSTVIGTNGYGATITAAQLAAFNSESGLDITILRVGTSIYGIASGTIMWRLDIASISGLNCQFGIFAYNGIAGDYHFAISNDTSIIDASLSMPTQITNGTVEASKTKNIKALDEIILTVTPDTGYILKSLIVNGEDVTFDVSDGTYTLSAALVNTVSVEFEENVDITQDVNIYLYKNGSTSAATEDVTVTLTKDGVELTEADNYTLVLSEGVLTIGSIKNGIYGLTISVPGYVTYSETLFFEGDNINVTLKYIEMTMSTVKYDAQAHDFAHTSDGYVTLTANKTLNAMSVDSYNDVSISFTIKESQSRHSNHIQGIFYLFEDGSYFAVQYHGKNYHLQMLDGLWNIGSTYIGTAWYGAEISQEYRDAFASDEGLTITILRCGTSIYGMVGNDILWRKDIASIAGKTCQVGIFAFDGVAGNYYYDISEDVSIVESTLTMPTEVSNGSISASKTENILAIETITLTVTPEENYVLKSLIVNGTDVTASVVDGTYSFTAICGENTVSVEFEPVSTEEIG